MSVWTFVWKYVVTENRSSQSIQRSNREEEGEYVGAHSARIVWGL